MTNDDINGITEVCKDAFQCGHPTTMELFKEAISMIQIDFCNKPVKSRRTGETRGCGLEPGHTGKCAW